MERVEFTIGQEFYTGSGKKWRCTGLIEGRDAVTAIAVDLPMHVERTLPDSDTTFTFLTDDPSWFNGPPYAVVEIVFDENDLGGCSLLPDEPNS